MCRNEEEYTLALESEVKATNKRFLAMYCHAANLAEKVAQQEILISALQHSGLVATRLVTEQKMAVKSTLALVIKEKFDSFMNQQMRPPPIHSPDMAKLDISAWEFTQRSHD